MKRLILTATALTALGLSITGCASTGSSLSLTAKPRQPVYFNNMSTETGIATDQCGQFKFSDPACNPALSAGGGGF